MITIVERRTFYSSSAGRCYLTKNAAIRAEVRSIIKRKYPDEGPESDEQGRIYSAGFHWTSLDRVDVLYRRLYRLVKKANS